MRGAGRTDAGVHAMGQVANFRTAARIPTGGFLRGLNANLPPDVAVLEVTEVPDELRRPAGRRGASTTATRSGTTWCARRCTGGAAGTAGRRWTWRRCGRRPPCWWASTTSPPSAPSDCERRTTRRLLRRVEVDRQGALLTIDVEGTAFLKNMVRILSGTLVAVGRAELTVERGGRPAGARRPHPGRHDRPRGRPHAGIRDVLRTRDRPDSTLPGPIGCRRPSPARGRRAGSRPASRRCAARTCSSSLWRSASAEAGGGDGAADDRLHLPGPQQQLPRGMVSRGALQGHRHDGHPGVDGQVEAALLERPQLAVARARPLGEQHHRSGRRGCAPWPPRCCGGRRWRWPGR